ncbi:MAG: prephenate dehydrogenase/arogenate dehydrogenase family protein [Pseudomonadaceae bacterium]|nr:prephenate dehydrogenase/arogenate dehydrogenase family protein [Pseudomonadaceae bacterium]
MPNKTPPLNKVVIVGVGLIGGSLGAAWRAASFAAHIIGIETNPAAAEQALQLGLVDEISTTVPADAELIAICTPSHLVAEQVEALASLQIPMFDVGSVKAPIIETLLAGGGVSPFFVPSHPIAGSDRSGPDAADADLFAGATTVLTPLVSTDNKALQQVESAWRACGSEVTRLAPKAHDEMLAVTSHLPHLLAYVFMQQVDPEHLKYSGGGFRDFTRIAAANPELWWRILCMNREQVLDAAEQFAAHLQSFTSALENNDEVTGLAALRAAASRRNQLDD